MTEIAALAAVRHDDVHSRRAGNAVADSPERAEILRRIAVHCRTYQGAILARSLGQAGLSLAVYTALIAVMIACVRFGAWPLALILSPLAAGMLVKLFTIQHDCGHGSFFESRRANNCLGFFLGMLTFTPYAFWRDAHNRHHASSGDLERRGVGAVDTLTVEEYASLSPAKQVLYRLYRHPAVMIFFGAPIYFIFLQRLPLAGAMPFSEVYHGLKASQVWRSVVALNVALAALYGGLAFWVGVAPVATAILPTIVIASWAGSWLFFVQHQYEDAYWAERPEWNYAEAAVFGSSHYDLPQPLQWLTGNIGLHHIHHLASRIPNYRLPECLRASDDLIALPRLTIRQSLRCARLALWDKAQCKMISFRAYRAAQ